MHSQARTSFCKVEQHPNDLERLGVDSVTDHVASVKKFIGQNVRKITVGEKQTVSGLCRISIDHSKFHSARTKVSHTNEAGGLCKIE